MRIALSSNVVQTSYLEKEGHIKPEMKTSCYSKHSNTYEIFLQFRLESIECCPPLLYFVWYSEVLEINPFYQCVNSLNSLPCPDYIILIIKSGVSETPMLNFTTHSLFKIMGSNNFKDFYLKKADRINNMTNLVSTCWMFWIPAWSWQSDTTQIFQLCKWAERKWVCWCWSFPYRISSVCHKIIWHIHLDFL